MAGLAERWFALADEDKDGKIGGAEAVRFFMRSGLTKDVLGQIWDLASGGAPALLQPQFNAAMRLVALAQVNMGRLPPDQARAVAMGGGPQVPLPRMAGLEQHAVGGGPQPPPQPYTLQVTGAPPPPYVAQSTGASSYAPQMTGAGVGAGSAGGGGYTPQMTGASISAVGYAPQLTGASAAGYAPPRPAAAAAPLPSPAAATPAAAAALMLPPGAFPPVSAEDMSRYRAQFAQLDRDGDGLVQGSDCFGVFMQTGLDKRTLKVVWDLAAGASGALGAAQFVRACYLMDRAKAGAPLPPALPPGDAFPPLAPGVVMPAATGAASGGGVGVGGGPAQLQQQQPPPQPKGWTLESQFGDKSASKAVAEVYDATLPRLEAVPRKAAFDKAAAAAAAGGAGASEVPELDGDVAALLAGPDKARYEAAREGALGKETALRSAETDAAAARARLEAFQSALAELTLFRSRADVALMTATDAAARVRAEADEVERRYHAAHLAAEGQFKASEAARKELQEALGKRQEAANRLQLLQQEVAMLGSMTPAEMAALQAEVAGLIQQVAAAEARKAELELRLDAGRKQRGLLEQRAGDLELAAAAGEAELGRVAAELAGLRAKVEALAAAPIAVAARGGKGSKGKGGDAAAAAAASTMELGDLCDALVAAARAYRSLLSAVTVRGADAPFEAALNNAGALAWADDLLAGTAEWAHPDAPPVTATEGDGGDAGFIIVNALPELEGVPPALLAACAAATGPLKPLARSLKAGGPAVAGEAAAVAAADAGKGEGAAAAAAADAAAEAGPGSGGGAAAAAAADTGEAAAAEVAAAPPAAEEAAAAAEAAPAAAEAAPAAAVTSAIAAGPTGSSVGEPAGGPARVLGRSSTADSDAALGDGEQHNPFSAPGAAPVWGALAAQSGGGSDAAAAAARRSDATDSSAFGDGAVL